METELPRAPSGPPAPPRPPGIRKRDPKPTWEIFSISQNRHLFVLMQTKEAAEKWLLYWIGRGYAPADLVIQPTANLVAHEVYDPETGGCQHFRSRPNADWFVEYHAHEEVRDRLIVRPVTGLCGRA